MYIIVLLKLLIKSLKLFVFFDSNYKLTPYKQR
jgi:hypothetical protein